MSSLIQYPTFLKFDHHSKKPVKPGVNKKLLAHLCRSCRTWALSTCILAAGKAAPLPH